MLLYYITDRTQVPGDEVSRRRRLLDKIAQAARCGVDYIQLREKNLSTRALEELTRKAVDAVRGNLAPGRPPSRLLVNSRTDVALAAGADGVHLRADDIPPDEVRTICRRSDPGSRFLVSVSCHAVEEVAAAAGHADFAVFAPVFEKKDEPGVRPAGLEALRQACRFGIPVLALGGVTLENAPACLATGAAGIAAIRLFQENDIAQVVGVLRP